VYFLQLVWWRVIEVLFIFQKVDLYWAAVWFYYACCT